MLEEMLEYHLRIPRRPGRRVGAQNDGKLDKKADVTQSNGGRESRKEWPTSRIYGQEELSSSNRS
jgi:hypothetical protein